MTGSRVTIVHRLDLRLGIREPGFRMHLFLVGVRSEDLSDTVGHVGIFGDVRGFMSYSLNSYHLHT